MSKVIFRGTEKVMPIQKFSLLALYVPEGFAFETHCLGLKQLLCKVLGEIDPTITFH